MTEPNESDSPDLEVPPEFVAALCRLEKRNFEPPPHIDEMVLSRPRLHLSRIRQWRENSPEPPLATNEDVALAAKTAMHGASSVEQFRPGIAGAHSRRSRIGWKKIALWIALAALSAIALVFALRACVPAAQ